MTNSNCLQETIGKMKNTNRLEQQSGAAYGKQKTTCPISRRWMLLTFKVLTSHGNKRFTSSLIFQNSKIPSFTANLYNFNVTNWFFFFLNHCKPNLSVGWLRPRVTSSQTLLCQWLERIPACLGLFPSVLSQGFLAFHYQTGVVNSQALKWGLYREMCSYKS